MLSNVNVGKVSPRFLMEVKANLNALFQLGSKVNAAETSPFLRVIVRNSCRLL